MHIKIDLKLRPFSHQPGTRCLIPFSSWEVEIFPAKLFFTNLIDRQKESLSLPIKGPVYGFTIMLNMEKERLEVFGKGAKGYFRYIITAGQLIFVKGEQIPLPFIKSFDLPPSKKRLSLGIHKKQDWELIKRRLDMAEIFPFWIRLAQLIPQKNLPKESIGTLNLLHEDKLDLFFQAGFQGMFSPRIRDENYLGLVEEVEDTFEFSPLGILHEGARKIEALFFKEEETTLYFLPDLPKDFHSGRFIGISTKFGAEISMEWSKKELKKVIIRPEKDVLINLRLQPKLKSFRLRLNKKQKGEKLFSDLPLKLRKGKTFFLDRFSH